MILKQISIPALCCGLLLAVSGCTETAPSDTGSLSAPPQDGPPVVGQGGMFQDANGCFVFANPDGSFRPMMGEDGNPICEG